MILWNSVISVIFAIFIAASFLEEAEYTCFTNYDQKKISSEMDNQNVETKTLKLSEVFSVELVSRGSLGLQLLFRMNTDSIVEVKRVEPVISQSNPPRPGDPIGAFFEIRALKKGMVEIIFYETQPWNKDFKDIIQKVIKIEVIE